MYLELAWDWVKDKVTFISRPFTELWKLAWKAYTQATLLEIFVAIGIFVLLRRIHPRVWMLMIGQMGPKISEDRRYYKQWNLLLSILWTTVAVLTWYWVRELAVFLLIAQFTLMIRMMVMNYTKNREGWKPGSAVLLSVWDAFGLWGDPFVWPIKSRIYKWGDTHAPSSGWLSKRLYDKLPENWKPTDPIKKLWVRYGRRFAKRYVGLPGSSKDPKPYDLDPWEGKVHTRYWVEEHRTPTKSYAGEQSVPLTDEQARELRRAVKGPHGKLYRKGTETMDPETGYAVDGEVIGTWHCDITVQHPNGRYFRWAAVPPKDPAHYNQEELIKPGMGKYDIFPGYVPDENGNTKSVSTTWILQPEHFRPTNPEVLRSGYGKGVCKVVKHGKCEVWLGHKYYTADGKTVRYFHFNPSGIDGKYAVVHDPAHDRHIVVRIKPRPIPRGGKLKMREYRPGSPEAEALFADPDWIAQAKKDGASGWVKVGTDTKGEAPATRMSVGSWRESKRLHNEYGVREPVDYTDKLHHLRDSIEEVEPNSLDFEGRVEVWAGGPNGSRNLQQKLQWDDLKAQSHHAKPYLYLVDITKWNGEDVTHLPYEERLKLIQQVHQLAPKTFKVPPTRMTELGKRNLWENGRDEPWVDGVVFKHRTDPTQKNVKLKYRWEDTREAEVLEVREGSGRLQGSCGSLYCRDIETGVEFSMAGEGMTDEHRQHLWENQDAYQGHRVEYYCDPDRMTYYNEVFQPTLAGFEPLPGADEHLHVVD